MLFSDNAGIPGLTAQADATNQGTDLRSGPAVEACKIRLGGGFRPMAQAKRALTNDAGQIRLGGGFRRSGQG